MVSRSEFYDYEAYVKKFQGLPSTTDDTFTPEGLYCDLLDYIDRKIFPLSGYQVERPFYPGGNYETYDYQENSVVIDNPPFSICGKIREFYLSCGIRYFLFIPIMTARPVYPENVSTVGRLSVFGGMDWELRGEDYAPVKLFREDDGSYYDAYGYPFRVSEDWMQERQEEKARQAEITRQKTEFRLVYRDREDYD